MGEAVCNTVASPLITVACFVLLVITAAWQVLPLLVTAVAPQRGQFVMAFHDAARTADNRWNTNRYSWIAFVFLSIWMIWWMSAWSTWQHTPRVVI